MLTGWGCSSSSILTEVYWQHDRQQFRIWTPHTAKTFQCFISRWIETSSSTQNNVFFSVLFLLYLFYFIILLYHIYSVLSERFSETYGERRPPVRRSLKQRSQETARWHICTAPSRRHTSAWPWHRDPPRPGTDHRRRSSPVLVAWRQERCWSGRLWSCSICLLKNNNNNKH